jgi:hypothetical protein
MSNFGKKETVFEMLRQNRLEPLQQAKAEVIQPLWWALEQRDEPRLRENARQVLLNLETSEAQEAFCRKVTKEGWGYAGKIITEAGYYPKDLSQRALFFFLLARWDDYDAIDFDGRMLRVYFRTADTNMRRRIVTKVQEAGQAKYLTIIAGSEYGASGGTFQTADEAGLLVELLERHTQWQRLWEFVPQLPFRWSMAAVRKLSVAGWQPTNPDEVAHFFELKKLADAATASGDIEGEANRSLSQAVMRAQLRVPGRVYDIQFATQRPVLAIATDKSKVVLWNMERAEIETTLEGFKFPIGTLTFLPDEAGTLICGERTQTNYGYRQIYAWDGKNRVSIGGHTGGVTALQALGTRQLLSVGRDGKALLWDTQTIRLVRELDVKITGWTPVVSLSHFTSDNPALEQEQFLALLHSQIDMFSLNPDLRPRGRSPIDLTNSLGHGAFSPDCRYLATARFNGEITAWKLDETAMVEETDLKFTDCRRSGTEVVGLATVRGSAVLLLATSDGIVQYLDWQTRRPFNETKATQRDERLTSLRVSPDGSFMALGDSRGTFSLWDLRLLSIARLFTEPLGGAQPFHLNSLIHVRELGLELSPVLKSGMAYLEALLRHRYRFEIEIGDFSTIRVGEFDIEME